MQYIASEMPCERMVALSAGFAFATAPKQWMRPMMVPSRPSRVATFEIIAR